MDKTTKQMWKKRRQQRSYEAAKAGRLNSTWSLTANNINNDIGQGLDALRGHSRDLSQNDAIFTRYLQLVQDGLIGQKGVIISPQARMANGKLDTKLNKAVREQWNTWGKQATVYKKSWLSMEKEVVRNVARDGECLIQIMRGRKYGKYGIRLKMIDPAHLDVSFHNTTKAGNDIRQSIELDDDGVPVAYWLWTVMPDDNHTDRPRNRVRVPAEDLLHIFLKEYPGQLRAAPWASSVMRDLKNLAEYHFTELVAARVGASSGVIITEAEGAEGDDDEDSDDGVNFRNLEPGVAEVLPHGYTVSSVNTSHPNGNFSNFNAGVVQRISAGLQVSYHSLSGDLSKANYSSMRQGAMTERDSFRTKQQWIIEELHTRIYKEWLDMSILMNAFPISIKKLEQVSEVSWKPRGFEYVDPTKDLEAIEKSLNNKLKSRSSAANDKGENYEDILAEIASDEELEAKYGVTPVIAAAPAPAKEEPEEEAEEESEDDKKKDEE